MLLADIYKEILYHLDIDTIIPFCMTNKQNYHVCDERFWTNKLNGLCLVEKIPNTLHTWVTTYKRLVQAKIEADTLISFLLPKITTKYDNTMYLEFTSDTDIGNLFSDDFIYKTDIIKLYKDVENYIDFKTIRFVLYPDIRLKCGGHTKSRNPIANQLFSTITIDTLQTLIHRLYYYHPNHEVEISYHSELGRKLCHC